ncbi:copper ion binding protein [Paenibacillus cellulositrophicus]|uniref:copper ion binding protein n=1 Tax=Paenibacillus cellulositrophicus TaxID=562959 RepID=UPI00203EB250|nr:copper ion binding protein [Paenibacillus cellulositrophicus]MCM2996976.1 copper ion binding protein [Paenibacillus cellulositrophicus]
MKTITLNVNGMSCQHCVNSIEGALQQIGAGGKVNLSNASVEVQFDETKLTESKIKETIEDQGYDVV